MLVGASDVVPNSGTSENSFLSSALISYGKLSDRMIIWTIAINETELSVDLQQVLVLRMLTIRPSFISLASSTVCMALEEDKIIMFQSHAHRQSLPSVPMNSLASIKLMRHQLEDSHSDVITSLNVCPYLRLFVSSSRDGLIKVWSFENCLVSEIDLGVPLASVGFANDRGDLLVGLQLRISIINVEDYLPKEYCYLSRTCPHWDGKEKPIAFNPRLKFW